MTAIAEVDTRRNSLERGKLTHSGHIADHARAEIACRSRPQPGMTGMCRSQSDIEPIAGLGFARASVVH
jgi:hypothetical protein